MEINRDQVIKLILQFFNENGFIQSKQILQQESQVHLNLLDSKQQLLKDIKDGKWDIVLNHIKSFVLKQDTLLDLYEIIVLELVEVNETKTANQFFIQMIAQQFIEYKERLLRLDYLIRKPGKLNQYEIYTDNLTKEQRRQKIGDQIINECVEAPPCRLLELLGDSLRFQQNNKININNYDLLLGQQNTQQKQKQISIIEKVIKYSEKMRVKCATFTPDGENLITGTVDGIIEIWDPKSYKIRNDLEYQANDTFMMHNNGINYLYAQQELLASLDNTGQVKLWKLKTGKCLKIIESIHNKQINCILIGKDPQQIFIASDYIQLYGIKSGVTQKQFRGHNGLITTLLQSNEGSRLYSTSLDQQFKVWDTFTAEQIFTLKCDSAIEKMFLIKGQILLCPRGKQLILLNSNYTEIKRFTAETELISCVAQQDYVYGLGQGELYSYELQSGNPLKLLKLPNENMEDFCLGNNVIFSFSQNGHLVFIV